MRNTTTNTIKATSIAGVEVLNGKLPQEVTELVRYTEPSLLFNHSTRVYYFGSLAGKKRGLKFDPELLYRARCFTTWG